jgi:hypothetical protein
MRGAGSSLRRRAAAARGAALGSSLLLGAFLLAGGCAREAPDVQAVRKVSERYLQALVQKDVEEVKRLATVVVSMASVAGGRVLSIGPTERIRLRTLDSLLVAGEAEGRTADSLWSRATEADADSLFRRVRLLNRRQVVLRCAQRAAQSSLPESALTSGSPIELRRVVARVRYAGERVGPKPVDRELVLRLLRAGSGDWIVFSFYLTADDVWPSRVWPSR